MEKRSSVTSCWDQSTDFSAAGAVVGAIQSQTRISIPEPPLATCRVSVIVPVRNEAETLEKTLSALANQVDFQDKTLDSSSYEVIVFANNCTDESAAIAEKFARRHSDFQLHIVEQDLPPSDAYIGRVRQLLMDEAYRRLSWLGKPHGMIASTDGDSQVDRRWIAAILYELGQGADAVGGRTVIDGAERAALDAHTRATYLSFVGYRYLIRQLEDVLDPDPFDRAPRHYQFFGANFAVTHEMYASVGGMPPVHTSEDVAFREALVRVGAKVRHSPLMRVTTSARQQGRASLGLADRLTQFQTLSQHQQPFLVEPAAAIEARLIARRDLRSYWQQFAMGHPLSVFAPQRLVQLATALAVPLAEFQPILEQASSWGDIYQQVERCQQVTGWWQQQWGTVPIEEAIAALRLRLHSLRQSAAT
ncbi:glycosyltransferase [Nodosilinea sp. LEGE 07088]|uniref:glycosyltransferase n=1 Tax=Nodosilinea sp. LEGE 07088 TaxID=2777968 RepID=UPI0018824998|nr:glycosyltransferase [Nodosilinea sp. LEGE 07088]MBE9137636.1 glycosyltransferase [Nodosilinea sp. LEGE 07088]